MLYLPLQLSLNKPNARTIMVARLHNFILSLLIILGSVTMVCAQSIVVQGTVYNSQGTPLPGVLVSVKLDHSKHTKTATDGKFTIEVDQKAILTFTLAGKQPAEAAASTKPLSITLQDEEKQKATVTTMRQNTSINTKYYPLWVIDGVVYKQDSTFNTADLASSDAKRLIAAALPGLSERDIQDFTVITDASATALYGNQAAGGVISVRTRRAGEGMNKITYTGQFTYRFIPSYREFNVLNSQDHLSVLREMEASGAMEPSEILYNQTYGLYGLMYDNALKWKDGKFAFENTIEGETRYLQAAEMRNTNWFKELYQHSVKHQHTISLASGNKRASYYATLGAAIDPGWAKVQKDNNYFFNLNATFNPSDHWSFNTIVNASYDQSHDGGDFTSMGTGSELSRALDPEAYYILKYTPFNLKNELRENYQDNNTANLRLQASLTWKPIRQFKAFALGSIQYYNLSTEYTRTEQSSVAERFRAMSKRIVRDYNSYLYKPADDIFAIPEVIMPEGGYRTTQEYMSRRFDFQGTATYNDSFADGKHSVFASIGTDIADIRETNGWHNEYGINFNLGNISTFDPRLFNWLHDSGSNYFSRTYTTDRSVAFRGNVDYTLLGRYTLDGSVRYEGTNRFGSSRQVRWIPTWNASASWDISQEAWFSKLSPLSYLSTKLSYGMTGTLPFVYNSEARISAHLPFRPGSLIEPGLYIDEPANSDLTYEKMYELDWNVALGFLDNRIYLSADLFSRRGRDLVDISYNQGTGGFFKPYGNVASMTAKGLELSLQTQNIKTKNFSWTTSISYSHNTNKVTHLDSRPDASTLVSGSGSAREGYPLSSIFSVPFYHLSEEGFPLFYNERHEVVRDDINFSASENLDYLIYSGTRKPTDQGGMNNSFKIGNVTIGAYLYYSFGGVERLPAQFNTKYDDYYALGHEFNRRWVRPGDENITNVPVIPTEEHLAKYPNLAQAYTTYNYSDVRIAKTDFIQLRDLSIGYTVPNQSLKKSFLSSLDFKLQASNVCLLYADKKLNGALPYDYAPHSIIFTVSAGI